MGRHWPTRRVRAVYVESDVSAGFDEKSDGLESALHRGQLERGEHAVGVRSRVPWSGLMPQSEGHEIHFGCGVHVDAEIEEPFDSSWSRVTRSAECVKCRVWFFEQAVHAAEQRTNAGVQRCVSEVNAMHDGLFFDSETRIRILRHSFKQSVSPVRSHPVPSASCSCLVVSPPCSDTRAGVVAVQSSSVLVFRLECGRLFPSGISCP